jgi:hypothetical protein
MPAFERAGVLPVYVDLWADLQADPSDLIAGKIARALAAAQTAGDRARGILQRVTSVTIAGVGVEIDEVGKLPNATLADALSQLHDTAGKPVALIIDEAQHALTSPSGDGAMFALKSARDQMNAPGDAKLRLVMSGSDRDKLLRLVNSNSAPFKGSEIRNMPVLGHDYIDNVANLVEQHYPQTAPIDRAALSAAFEMFSHRPEPFISAYRAALDPTAQLSDNRFEQRVLEAAQRQLDQEAREHAATYLALRPIEQAIISRMLEMQDNFRPMDADALAAYRSFLGEEVNTNQVNTALQGLRDRQPPLIWKSNRGEYALADAAMDRWYEQCRAAGAWPPTLESN